MTDNNPRVRIVHITDSHHQVGHPQLARAIEVINGLTRQPDLVVHGGDVVNGYTDEAGLEAQMAEAASILADLQAPLLLTCCNHDTHGESVRGETFKCHFHDHWVQDRLLDDVYVIGLSGNVTLQGNLPDADDHAADDPWRVGEPWSLRLMAERLARQPTAVKLVFSHVPVFPVRRDLEPCDPAGKDPRKIRFEEKYAHRPDIAAAYSKLLSQHGVQAHYAGHVHLNGRVTHDGVEYVTTSATQSFPGEFRLIDIYQDRIENRMIQVPGGYDIWVRWQNAIDRTHRSVHEFYFGQPHERDFVITLDH